MELTVFIAAHMVLCFRFLTRTVLTALMFLLLLITCTASLSQSVHLESRLRVGNSLGGDSAGTAGLRRPKRYSIPHNTTFSNMISIREFFQGRFCWEIVWSLVCCREVVSGCFLHQLWVCLFLFYFLHFLHCLFLLPWVFFLLLPFQFSPTSHWEGVSKQLGEGLSASWD